MPIFPMELQVPWRQEPWLQVLPRHIASTQTDILLNTWMSSINRELCYQVLTQRAQAFFHIKQPKMSLRNCLWVSLIILGYTSIALYSLVSPFRCINSFNLYDNPVIFWFCLTEKEMESPKCLQYAQHHTNRKQYISWITLALPFSCCVALGKLLNLSEMVSSSVKRK